jgi:hypothetical protein
LRERDPHAPNVWVGFDWCRSAAWHPTFCFAAAQPAPLHVAQHALKVTKQQAADGSIDVARSDIYHGGLVAFVPFTRLDVDLIRGTHSHK